MPSLAIPATLHDSLMARLDRLATGRKWRNSPPPWGGRFPTSCCRAVSPLDEATLQQALARLVEAELLYQRGVPPQATYLFKHALIQETAYQSLLKSTRQQYHQRIAQVLDAQFPETAETQPELLAHHYTEAGLREQAIAYWQRAGQQALQRSANLEAVQHLTTGLALLATLPETPARAQQELDLQIALGPALMATKGYGGPRGGADLRPGAGVVRAGRRDAAALPDAAGLMAVLSDPRGIADGAGAGGTALQLAQRAADADAPPGGP